MLFGAMALNVLTFQGYRLGMALALVSVALTLASHAPRPIRSRA
jgi:uncharacterized membrane protein (UPF0136 family)